MYGKVKVSDLHKITLFYYSQSDECDKKKKRNNPEMEKNAYFTSAIFEKGLNG